MRKFIAFLSVFLVLSMATGCNLPFSGNSSSADDVSTLVAETLAAMTQQAGIVSPQASEPTFTPYPTLTFTPDVTAIPTPGSISGNVYSYPYGSLPRLSIVAIGQTTGNWTYVINSAGDSYFFLTSKYLLPEKYLVVAYDSSGHAGGCPTLVTVISEQTVNCDITDWSGSYPARPDGVPPP
jgi:hypothetical protein